MNLTQVKKVGIIGSGVAGLTTAKLLHSQGLDCTIFERNSVLGGVWAAGYSNFGVQVQKELYEFPDWPLSADVPNFTPGPVIQNYLEDYAKHFDIWPNIRFNTTVTGVKERTSPSQGGWVVTAESAGKQGTNEFDLLVICTGLFSNIPYMPQFAGEETFNGRIIHISEFTTRDIVKNKKVVVVGFGKSASDAALEASKVASKTTIVFREPHWPVPPNLLGILPFKWAMLNRLTSSLIPPYVQPSNVERVVHSLGKPLVWFWWRLVELLLIAQCRLWSRFGTRPSLIPQKPVEIDTFGESTMLPRPNFYSLMRNGSIEPHQGQISEYQSNSILLNTGEKIEADVVILATGWKSDFSFLPESVMSRLNFEDDGFYLYRHILNPQVPNLAFIGIMSTISNMLTYNLQALWLCELIKGTHQLPSGDEMQESIEQLKAWKRSWMPFSRARSSRLLLHMLHYHDELLKDIGISPLRKTGIFAPFKEAFAPYQPSDYKSIVSGKA